MATNFYFNNFQASQEQNLLADLVMESIKIYGNDTYYLPYQDDTLDTLYGEDKTRAYNNNVMIEMYIKSVDGFGGDGSFLGKFGVEIRDTITFSISVRAFNDEVGRVFSLDRPREGDLIWFVPSGRLFKITYVDKYPTFLQLGSVPFYDVKCEMFEHSGERFNTGLDFIDNEMQSISSTLNVEALMVDDLTELTDEDGYTLIQDAWDINTADAAADNDVIETEADNFLNFTEIDPFSEGAY